MIYAIGNQAMEELHMSRLTKVGIVLASLFTLVNVGGMAIAGGAREWPHMVLHVALALAGAYLVWWLWPESEQAEGSPRVAPPPDDRIELLQQSVDAVALEVERIGEAQRYAARLQQDRTSGGR